MTYSNQNTVYYLVIAVAVVVVIYLMMDSKKYDSHKENLSIAQRCRCEDCVQAVNKLKRHNNLFGCAPRNNPYEISDPELCEMSYRKKLLHGCNVAGLN